MQFKTFSGIILAFVLLLQGCGHKGALTHPVPDAQKPVSPVTPQSK